MHPVAEMRRGDERQGRRGLGLGRGDAFGELRDAAAQRRLAIDLGLRPRLVGARQAKLERAHAQDPVELTRLGHCLVRSEEHTSELPSLMRISYAVFCLKKKKSSK